MGIFDANKIGGTLSENCKDGVFILGTKNLNKYLEQKKVHPHRFLENFEQLKNTDLDKLSFAKIIDILFDNIDIDKSQLRAIPYGRTYRGADKGTGFERDLDIYVPPASCVLTLCCKDVTDLLNIWYNMEAEKKGYQTYTGG